MGIWKIIVGLSLLACGFAAQGADLSTQRAAFRTAWTFAAKGDLKGLTPYLAVLKDYPLYPYLEYAYLKATLDTQPDEAVERFLAAQGGEPVGDALRRAWILSLARRQDWGRVLAYYGDETDPSLRCADLSAHVLKQDQPDRKAWTTAAERLWLAPATPQDACAPLFDYLVANGFVTADLWRRRMEILLQARDYTDARRLLPKLPVGDRAWAELWLEVAQNPSHELEDIQVPDEWVYQEMLLANLRTVARSDPGRARHLWTELSSRYRFSHDDARDMRTILVLQRAWHLMPDARSELKRFHEAVDPQVQEWRTRLAIRDGDWREALGDIAKLGESQSSPEWRYWKARALEALGRKTEAKAIYIPLSRGDEYYAFLAADRAHLPYSISQQVSKPEPEVIDALEARPGFTRARELVYADLYDEADAEWQAATADLSTPARCQAALLAERWGWHARVIPMLASGGCWQDLALIYPIAFEQTLVPEAQKLKLDLSWVYGLIRAESVFRPNAVSRVGARGLMQLMPGTGLDVATRLGLPVDDADDLLDPATNLAVGGIYLRDMLAHYGGSEPLATAAYNAGPDRVDDWMPDGELPADVWVDTIPYTETREYVRRVLGHTVIFDWRLNGKPEPLTQRLGLVGGAEDTDTKPVAALP